jgi:hypothetical protein
LITGIFIVRFCKRLCWKPSVGFDFFNLFAVAFVVRNHEQNSLVSIERAEPEVDKIMGSEIGCFSFEVGNSKFALLVKSGHCSANILEPAC